MGSGDVGRIGRSKRGKGVAGAERPVRPRGSCTALIRLCLLAMLALPGLAHAAAVDAPGDDAAARAVAVMQAHVRMLHDRLRISADQDPAWAAVADAMMANARHVAALHAQQEDGPESAPGDLRRYAAIAQAHAEDAQRLVAPFEALYAVMTPEQRTVADQTFRKFEQERMRRAGL